HDALPISMIGPEKLRISSRPRLATVKPIRVKTTDHQRNLITGTSSWKKDADDAIRPTAVVKQASSTTPEKTMSPAVPREILDASDSTAAPSEYCPLSGIFVPITPSARYTISRKKPASTAAIEEYLTTVLRSVTPWALKELTTMIAKAIAAMESIVK